jgi:P27 family predicted phage terminase small subunit
MSEVQPESQEQKQIPAPPNKNPVFVQHWNKLVVEIMTRENFKEGHLYQLAILCDAYVEYYLLKESLELTGYTYTTIEGRNGTQVKPYPEVQQLNRTRAEIRSLSKQLGLILYKDTETRDEVSDDWD